MFANTSKFWKFFHFIPVFFVYCIIYWVVYSFTYSYVLDNKPVSISKILLVPFFYFMAFMTFYCHVISMVTNPGEVDQKYVPKPVKSNDEEDKKLFCKKCNISRPERAHHCKMCKKCYLKMDHHCPWIANCVGHRNQKAFYLFLFYATFGDLLAALLLLQKILAPDFLVTYKTPLQAETDNIFLMFLYVFKDQIINITGFALSLCMTLAIGGLFCYQTYLIFNNMTSIESANSKKKEDCPYHYKNKLHCLSIVLGLGNSFWWFFPNFTPNIYNNGYSYVVPGKQSGEYVQLKEEEFVTNSIDDTKRS